MATITETSTTGRHRESLRRWVNDSRTLQRIAAGLRALEHLPPACRYTDQIRGYSHALHVMDIHRHHHRCPRYVMADEYSANYVSPVGP